VNHLYVHIPFCHRICPYCSFHKHTPGGTDMVAFVDAVLKEADKQPIKPRTIFFGGGTPTMLSEVHLERLLARITRAGGHVRSRGVHDGGESAHGDGFQGDADA
jgi:coproporphyrinogen III oxidase-like Fe-S oxidoreductase